MPLPTPVDRKPIHTRAITCQSYDRADGLFDIEGHLTDVKSYGFPNRFRGEIKAGEPIHDMWLRLTVDGDFVVRAVEAATDAGPFAICPAIIPAFQKLVGERIGRGWKRRVRELLGGVQGCTHLVDLLDPIATVAFHTVRWSRSAPKGNDRPPAKPPLNTCHAWAVNGSNVRDNYPEYYSAD